jgi:hypothetical protein
MPKFATRHPRRRVAGDTDAEFVAGLQKAADWLTARKVLPEKVTVISRSL